MVGKEGKLECPDFDDEPEVLASIGSVGKGVRLLPPYGRVDGQGDAFEAAGRVSKVSRQAKHRGLTPVRHSQDLFHDLHIPVRERQR